MTFLAILVREMRLGVAFYDSITSKLLSIISISTVDGWVVHINVELG